MIKILKRISRHTTVQKSPNLTKSKLQIQDSTTTLDVTRKDVFVCNLKIHLQDPYILIAQESLPC